MKTILAFLLVLLAYCQSSFAQKPAVESLPAKMPVATLPIALKAPAMKFPKGAPEGRYVVSVAFVVDEKGVPRHPHIVQSDNEYFDFNATITALQYRFKPGTRDGRPVPTPLTVQFAYDKESKWRE